MEIVGAIADLLISFILCLVFFGKYELKPNKWLGYLALVTMVLIVFNLVVGSFK
jgi:hypothetical protein